MDNTAIKGVIAAAVASLPIELRIPFVTKTLPQIEASKSQNRLSQKGRRKRARWIR